MNFSRFYPRNPGFSLISVFFLVFGLLGCKDPEPRVYVEAGFKPNKSESMAGPGMMGGSGIPMDASPADVKVTWTLPDGWQAKDSANALRIGSFLAPDPSLANVGEMDPHAVDVSVVRLAGDGGGLKANILRWMGQVGIKSNPEEMEEFVKAAKHFKTKTGQDGMYVDLTDKLSGDMTQSKTIFGAVIQTADYTVFIKGMGEQARVLAVKPVIIGFCESLRIEGPSS